MQAEIEAKKRRIKDAYIARVVELKDDKAAKKLLCDLEQISLEELEAIMYEEKDIELVKSKDGEGVAINVKTLRGASVMRNDFALENGEVVPKDFAANLLRYCLLHGLEVKKVY